MVRNLILKLEDFEFKANLKPFSRDSIYGRKIIEKRTEEGSVLQHVYLTSDGIHILFSRGIGSSYLDKSGNYHAKIVDVDEDGKEIPKTLSMYKAPVNLQKTITIEEYFGYDIERSIIVVVGKYVAPIMLEVSQIVYEGEEEDEETEEEIDFDIW